MSKTILFSPVGGTDPISATNLSDGSLLHIFRCYKPDEVYLFMSKEILALHEKDNRYLYCLDRLAERQKRSYKYEIIARPEMENVQEFDYFYRDFREIIQLIMKSMTSEDQLLLNISSGTPAMKSGLLVLKTLGEFPCKAIQVVTPERKMNEHIHKGYDVELLWELDEDNSENYVDRCSEVKCPTLSMLQQENLIKKLIREYDYHAALEIAKTLPGESTKTYLDLLEMASKRLLLDFSGVDQILQHNSEYVLPVRDSGIRKYFEYALSLQVKLNRCEYADFIRGISPILMDLFERVLEKQTGLKLRDYCVQKGNKAWNWDRRKMQGTEVERILEKEYQGFRYGDISSDHLCVLIQELGKDLNEKMIVKKLRSVEGSLRNLAAHQIISVTGITIQSQTGYTGKQIMEMLKKTFAFAEMGIKKEYWDSYDDMNTVIVRQMDKMYDEC